MILSDFFVFICMIRNVVRRVIKEIYDDYEDYEEPDEYFSPKLPMEIKERLNKFSGRGVIWYGDPEQMIVVHSDDVVGMFGNEYDRAKLSSLVRMIENSLEKVELECSYAYGSVVDMQNVLEHQVAEFNGHFSAEYEGHKRPYSTGDKELDKYLGNDEFLDDNFDFSTREIRKFIRAHKYPWKSVEELTSEFHALNPNEDDLDNFDQFLEIYESLQDAIDKKSGDLGKFKVQLRDGHHRVFGAIEAGEEYVCVNLKKEELQEFKNFYTKVTQKGP